MPKPSKAAAQYENLSSNDRASLLDQIFDLLEYDGDGNPGGRWSPDTFEDIGKAFNEYGVYFTDSDVDV